ncbi:DUF3048 domain-containing protein [Nocardioides rubriscoriae]|uniref:DUF3048 domain-containing protein n=1 Tax=Nocardioides rubriscoriae TaxID=642762 RepID=UPI0011E03776|nr:DUF3048 domain-containing protein [Nocardioides rubriscoriae]
MPFPRTPHVPALAAAVALCLALAACGGGDEQPAAPDGTAASAPRAEVSGNPDTWPLTGLMVQGGTSVRKHPVLVLKMDNTPSSDPQLGLGSADLVVEELVEGGVTRLAAFYYSTIPGVVGPVRSMRASDIGIVSPVDGDMVTSGAASVTIQRIEAAGIDYYTEGSPGFFRDSSRYAPYNLFTDMGEVAKAAEGVPGRPVDYLPFGPDDDLPAGQPATSVRARFSPGHTTTWSYRDGSYVNVDGYAADGDAFPADTVLVLRVKVGDAGYRDPAGNPVPETVLKGSGDAMLFHGGRLVRGTWGKSSLDSPIKLTTRAGALDVPPGHTWIELVPAATGDVTFD